MSKCRLSDVASVHYGKSPKEVVVDRSSVPVIGTGGVYAHASRSLFSGPAVVVPRKGSLAKPQYVQSGFWPSDTTYAVIPRAGVDARWLYYSLDSFDLTKLNEATGVPSISRDWLLKIRLADVADEGKRQIADILASCDQVIDQTKALIAKTQQIKAGLMHDLFTRGVLRDGRLRPTRNEAPHLYKDCVIGTVPREWDVSRLASKRRCNRAHLKTGPFGSSLKLEHWVAVGHPVITIGSLGDGKFIESELLFVAPATVRRMQEYQLAPGDIVFSRVADVGRSAVIREEQDGWIMSGNMMRISLDPEEVIPDYLQAQLAYDMTVRRQIRRSVNAGGREVANSAILNGLWFAWPSREEQARAMQRVAGVQAMLAEAQAEAEKCRQIRRGLMHDLLTGSVRVQVGQGEMGVASV